MAGAGDADAMQAPLVLVAAMDRNRAIGRDNQLPWRLPDDLQRFKALTVDQTILMGRRTAQSLGRALPHRRNLVLTRSGQVPYAGMEAVASLDEARRRAGAAALYVVGGGEIYALALPHAGLLHLTLVDCAIERADAYFPAFDQGEWRPCWRAQHAADGRHAHAFEFVDYRRRPG